MIYPVVTSNPAQKDFANIQAKHTDIVNGMAMQSARIQSQDQARLVASMNQHSEDLKQNNEQKKLQMQQEELSIKRAALI